MWKSHLASEVLYPNAELLVLTTVFVFCARELGLKVTLVTLIGTAVSEQWFRLPALLKLSWNPGLVNRIMGGNKGFEKLLL